MFRYRCDTPVRRLLREFVTGRIAVAAVIGICALWAAPASAYRPFDGTDAAVADVGEVEIEFQPIGALRAGPTKGLSDAIFNFGFADRWELVLQGTPQVLPEGSGPISVSNGAFLKYVLQPGVLQDKSGPSVATEFGPLLPPSGGSGVGFGLTGIVSQRWDWGTVHLNAASNLTPDQHGELFFDASSRDRANGKSGRSLKSIRTASSPNRKRSLVWSGPYGK